ncbi:ABC transporter permease [Candidatus Woesearchaeota archaeon]|nr:ABC transporter permease [Candidatus Woesearchaeota archaeon]
MRRLIASLRKNARNLLRNWTTVSVIFIGPFILLLILMFSYSSSVSGVRVGYVLVDQYDGTSTQKFVETELLSYSWRPQLMYSISQCHTALRNGQVHLCLLYSAKKMDIYYDPAREEVGLILLADIRRNLAEIEQERIRTQTGEVLDDIKNTDYFLEQSKVLGNRLVADLDAADVTLVGVLDQIDLARQNITGQRAQLSFTRERLVYYNGRIQDPYLNNVALTRNSLTVTRNQLVWLQSQAGQNAQLKATIGQAINQIMFVDDTLLQAENDLRSAQTDLTQGIATIDSATEALVQADATLLTTRNDVENARLTIGKRRNEVTALLIDLDKEQEKLNRIGNQNVDDLIGVKKVDVYAVDRLNQISPTQGDIKYKVPTILAMLAMFISIILSNILFQEEVHGKAYLRNRLMSFRGSQMLFVGSILLTSILITFVESILFLTIAEVFFSFAHWSIFTVSVALLNLIVIYSIVGIIIGYLVSEKASSLLACVFVILINILLGGIFVPIEKIVSGVAFVSSILPISSSIGILERALFHSVSAISHYVALFFGVAVSLILLVVVHLIVKKKE